jgi:hypothetical protein
MIQAGFKKLAYAAHPDRGGNTDLMQRLSRAREWALGIIAAADIIAAGDMRLWTQRCFRWTRTRGRPGSIATRPPSSAPIGIEDAGHATGIPSGLDHSSQSAPLTVYSSSDTVGLP